MKEVAMRPNLRLWNQKKADFGSFLFGRMAASYNREQGSLLQIWVSVFRSGCA
jgi:hypothetical protein